MCSGWFFPLILEEFHFQYYQPLYVSFLILSRTGRNVGGVALEGSKKQAEVDGSMSLFSKKPSFLIVGRVISIVLALVDLFFLKDCYKTHDSSWETLLLLSQ